jgi:hypothetical protein
MTAMALSAGNPRKPEVHQPQQIVDGAVVAGRFLDRLETHLALVEGLSRFCDENA